LIPFICKRKLLALIIPQREEDLNTVVEAERGIIEKLLELG